MTVDQAESRAILRYSAWRFIPPSVRDIIFIALFWSLLMGPLSDRPLADPDIGWHIVTGEQILVTHSLPRTDPYSSTMHGQPWFAWEWLYDIALAILYRAGGLNGVVWICAVLVAATFTILLSQLLKLGVGLPLAIVLVLLAEAASTIHLFARPHIVSWLFVLLWFVALDKWQRSGKGSPPRWLPWFFPLSMLLWVNLHGEWVFGLALLAIYTMASFVDSLRDKDEFSAIRTRHRAQAMTWAWGTSAAATFLNPFGWCLHVHIYRYLNDRYLMNRIAEFRSPDFHGWAQRCFGILLVLTLVAIIGHSRRIRLSHLLVVLLAVYSGLLSSRNLPVSSILLVLVIGPLLWESFSSWATKPGVSIWIRRAVRRIVGFSDRMGAQELELQGHIWPVVCTVAALAICFQGGWLGSHRIIHAAFDPNKIPVAAVDYLEAQPNVDPVFSIDSWGGYLIYRLYPRRRVVVDDRHDLYGSSRFREVLILLQGEPGWRAILEKWQIRTALLPAGSTLDNLLRELPQEWQLTYEDRVSVVFEKK